MGLQELYVGRAGGIEGVQDGFESRVESMIRAMPENLRGQVNILSAFRSVQHQQELWDKAVIKYGSPEAARKWVAPPGKSNHGRGVAIDLRYSTEAARKWFHSNANRFGLAFPMAHEPWHIEPLGYREGNATSFIQAGVEPADPEAYTDGQGIPEVNNRSLETQFLRVVDLMMGGGTKYDSGTVQDSTDTAAENTMQGMRP